MMTAAWLVGLVVVLPRFEAAQVDCDRRSRLAALPDNDRDKDLNLAPSVAAPLSQDGLVSRLSLDLIEAGTFIAGRQNAISGAVELRPNLKLIHGDVLQVVVRPRFFATANRAHAAGQWQPLRSDGGVVVREAFGVYTASDAVSVVYGLQNYQWGSAEFINASNRIFNTTALQRDALFEVQGKHLLRVNLSAGQNLTGMVMSELGPVPFEQGPSPEPFHKKVLVKVEQSGDDGGNYVGLVAGGGEGTPSWVGEYGALKLTDGLTMYGDASTQKVSDTFQTLAVVGAKYAFENGSDAALEVVQNEVPDRRYVFAMARLNDVVPGLDDNLMLRYMHSLSDHSGTAYLYFDLSPSDADVIFMMATWNHGPEDGELSQFARGSMSLGHKHVW